MQKGHPRVAFLHLFHGGEKQGPCGPCAGDSKASRLQANARSRDATESPICWKFAAARRTSSSAARRGRALYLTSGFYWHSRRRVTTAKALPSYIQADIIPIGHINIDKIKHRDVIATLREIDEHGANDVRIAGKPCACRFSYAIQ
ncbi:hypothetical protein GJ700_27750 [Duganella sp. FT92W]|uniref:Uncharacterized protein n=1 Tax=Pseudoduganella rivuli TaxID=2666085 RepID=A0A7X2ISX7_9BURK|nr:hypothetical protein [Pseudoduganella rivuli]MRV75520.1 hypothetical protein [Pseudoduganella rivuli]